MKYLSPIRLFEYCNIDYTISLDVKKIKKIIALEFSFAEEGNISLENLDYSKDQILKEIERDDFLQRLNFHILIWKEKSLLNFLENRETTFPDSKNWLTLKDNPDFKSFISPYFSYSLHRGIKKNLNPVDFEQLSKGLDLLIFIDNSEDELNATESIRIFINSTLKYLKNVNSKTYKSILPQFTPWQIQHFSLFINKLPPSLDNYTSNLVTALINFTVEIQFENKKLCYQISKELILIQNTDNELKKLIASNHRIYKKKFAPSKIKKFGKIILILYLCFMAAAIIHGVFFGKEKKSKKNIKEDIKIEKEMFIENRKQFSTIHWDSASVLKNNKIIMHKDAIYYLIFKNKDNQKKQSSIKFINNSKYPLIVSIPDQDNDLLDLQIESGKKLSVEVNNNIMDLQFRLEDNSSSAMRKFKSKYIPVLIAGSLNLSSYKINFNQPEKKIHIENPKGKDDVFVKFETDAKNHTYFFIEGYYDWAVPKKVSTIFNKQIINLPYLPAE